MAEFKTMHVTPMPGHLVRDPETREALPPGGAVVPWDTYWRRRLLDGSIQAGVPTLKEKRPPLEAEERTPPEAPASGNRPKKGDK